LSLGVPSSKTAGVGSGRAKTTDTPIPSAEGISEAATQEEGSTPKCKRREKRLEVPETKSSYGRKKGNSM